ncbi:DinB family protein [Edaphobacillus lindanitolerans]|nr:DinB family protein [Edaphobacillus lindanitolerans]
MDDKCAQVFRQIEFMHGSVLGMANVLTEADLAYRPWAGKRSLGELLGHMALLCSADLRLSDGDTEDQMKVYYRENRPDGLKESLLTLSRSVEELRGRYDLYTAASLEEKTTSWWGATYTRFGWLVQIAVHLAHHRGQLHSMLLTIGKDPERPLFE